MKILDKKQSMKQMKQYHPAMLVEIKFSKNRGKLAFYPKAVLKRVSNWVKGEIAVIFCTQNGGFWLGRNDVEAWKRNGIHLCDDRIS